MIESPDPPSKRGIQKLEKSLNVGIAIHEIENYILSVTLDVERTLMCVDELMSRNFITSRKTRISSMKWEVTIAD